MNQFFLSAEELSVSLGGKEVLKNIHFRIAGSEQWALTGPSGSGKTVLAHTLAGRHFYKGSITASFGEPETFHRSVAVVEQQHRFRDTSNRADFYYQQRYNSFDAERTCTVGQDLAPYLHDENKLSYGLDRSDLLQLLKVDQLLTRPLIQLSNGENKRLQLVKALLEPHELLILDQPFIGLDISGRQLLRGILEALSRNAVKMILITAPHEVPGYITHVAEMDDGRIVHSIPKQQYLPAAAAAMLPVGKEELEKLVRPEWENFEFAIRMNRVSIRYDSKMVLTDIDWNVKRGERWSLSGPNGAGKSTLLSLVTGDNPQAYANEIYLFDKRRGSGESIWDIKQKIGYASPELHLYFDPGATSFEVLASGLFDTIGLFRRLQSHQELLVMQWIELLRLGSRKDRLLSQLSLGEQRLVLLARALIKNPPLLVLDEPCQGLDDLHASFFRSLVELFCHTFHTTLIYVSHYRPEVPDCVDHFLHMEAGRITGLRHNVNE